MSELPTISFPTSAPPVTSDAVAPGRPFRSKIGAMSFVTAIEQLSSAYEIGLIRMNSQGGGWGGLPDGGVSGIRAVVSSRAEGLPRDKSYRQIPEKSAAARRFSAGTYHP